MNSFRIKSAVMICVLSLTLCVFTMGTAMAQFTIGLKVAGNADNYSQLTSRNFGAEAGLFMRLGDRFYFQPEVNYVFKSSVFQNSQNIFSSNSDLKQHFVALPLLLGYHFVNNKNFKFHLTAGPRFDFRLMDNMEGTDWHTNVVQWGGQVGAGIDVWLFTLDFSYCIAADNFRNTSEGVSQTKHMNMFMLSLGFKFIK